jgi:hypothetical protein
VKPKGIPLFRGSAESSVLSHRIRKESTYSGYAGLGHGEGLSGLSGWSGLWAGGKGGDGLSGWSGLFGLSR